MVFLNFPYRETPKNALNSPRKNEFVTYMIGRWVADIANVRAGPSIFFGGPSGVFGLLSHQRNAKETPSNLSNAIKQSRNKTGELAQMHVEVSLCFFPAAPCAPLCALAKRQ
jgi:hypothetical protein